MATRNICGNNTFVLRNPTSEQLFAVIVESPASMTIMIMAILLTSLTVLVFIEGEFYICKRIPSRRKVHLSFIMGIYPVFSVTSLLSLLVPRAAIITKFTAQIYMSVALIQFVMLINSYYGGRDKMLKILEGIEIPIASPPCLCCCKCCIPKTTVNEKNITKFVRRTRTAVLQVAIVKPFLWFIATVLWTNGTYRPGDFTVSSAYLWLTVFATISTITALQGLIILYKTSRDPLKDFKLRPKFFTVQMALVITNVQTLIITFLAAGGVIGCKGPLTPGLRAMYIDSIVTIVEMFFFMILAMIWYRRLEGNVHKDELYDIMSKRYARLQNVYGKDHPSATPLTLQDQLDRESLAGSHQSSQEPLETPIANGVIPHDGGQTMDRNSNSSKNELIPNGNCLNEIATEEMDTFDEYAGPVQALWLHRGADDNGFIPTTTSRPKRWSDNEFRINWTVVDEVTDRETDV
ncbi:organic solute transporter subunit alpha-like [Amphiura filiformis]|uniref:organic solute transporter subunit alpha-like n=1 Tax=Amphiura filiformis TaxID=82378 RepID=UPI003B212C2D